jgi:hypothetical protein
MTSPLGRRVLALVAVVVVCVAGTGLYLWHARAEQEAAVDAAPPVPTASATLIHDLPRIVFRSTLLGTGYGEVAMVPLSDPSADRALTGTACERVYAVASRVLCLAADRGFVTTYSATVLDADLSKVQDLPLSGMASRARLSDDGALAATTTFISGHSYASASFVTQTLVTRLGGEAYGNLEEFTIVHDGTTVKPVDRNVWGVTFASDDDTFYATAAWGGKTWLVRGSLSQRRLTTLHEDAECPSLSPDGRTVVYKKRLGRPAGQWRLAAYDLSSGKETLLAEQRSIDDQVTWLDDATVIYGLGRSGSESAVSDVWAVPADGTGSPRVLLKGAWSPAVVR